MLNFVTDYLVQRASSHQYTHVNHDSFTTIVWVLNLLDFPDMTLPASVLTGKALKGLLPGGVDPRVGFGGKIQLNRNGSGRGLWEPPLLGNQDFFGRAALTSMLPA